MLQVKDLHVRIGLLRVLSGVTFTVNDGDVLLITGGNGAGKSTLLAAILSLEPARVESGSILFQGREITRLPAHEKAALGIAYLPQRYNVFSDLTVEENLRVALGPSGPSRFRAEYAAWSEHLPLGRRAALLSGGQQQRLAWAMTALRPSRLLLADEPEAGLSEKLPFPKTDTLIIISHSRNWLTPTKA